MSEEKVEIVRRIYEASARGDADALLTLYDPEVEWDMSRQHLLGDLTGVRVYRGHQGLLSLFREYEEAWENVEYELEELIAAGEQVISSVTMRGRGQASGIEVDRHGHGVWTIRDGKVVRVVWFPTHAEALKAAGLRE